MAFFVILKKDWRIRPLLRSVWTLAIVFGLGVVVPFSSAGAQEAGVAEVEFWSSVKEARDSAELRAYLKAYPAGHFAELARIRLNRLLTGESTCSDRTAEKSESEVKPAPNASNAEISRQLDLFADVLQKVGTEYVEKPNDTKLIENAILGMLQGLDPHSTYLTPKEVQDGQAQTRGDVGGFGLELTMEEGLVKVIAPIDDGPASRAGILAGDLITHIDGESLNGLTLNEAVEKMRGPVDSLAVVTVLRKGLSEPIYAKIARDVVRIVPVKFMAMDNVGWIKVTTFQSERTSETVKQAIDSLKKSIGPRTKGYIIDLRNNPGGILEQGSAVSDAFLDRGVIVQQKGRNANQITRTTATPGDVAGGKPIVVLIDGGSAGASEVVAGALQDHKRAQLVGTRSFGMGTVQTMIPLKEGNGSLRLTTARLYTPSGKSLQANGVVPDIVVENQKGSPQGGPDDLQLNEALKLLRAK